MLWDAKRRHQDPRKALNGFVLLANEVSSSLSAWHAEVGGPFNYSKVCILKCSFSVVLLKIIVIKPKKG